MRITLKSQLEEIKKSRLESIAVRNNDETVGKHMLMVCGGTGCHSARSKILIDELNEQIREAQLQDKVEVVQTGCFGFCSQGPIVQIHPDDTFYVRVQVEDAKRIVQSHIVNNVILDDLLFFEPTLDRKVKTQHEMVFYQKQIRIALRNCGVIDPECIDDYIAYDGFKALEKVLHECSPQEVCQMMTDSGLRGRGGAGFPTGIKWEATRKVDSDEKYVICNADEGDPGAFMDRSILEGDPLSVIEAMAICGYAVGASKGFVYIRAEYPLAIDRLKLALDQAREYGLLGENIFDAGFNFDIEIKYGAGAFVCGEETALMMSIEGSRGEPFSKTVFPSEKGLFGKPTCTNNVETFANIPAIIVKSPEWYASIGTEKSKGTKVFALGGKIKNVGLVEVPMGITLRELIYETGGGIDGGEFKAAQSGGPSGGCIPAEFLDTQIDYESLTSIGSMMGSGGMIILDDHNCIVDIAKFYLDFICDESCGKCTPCRIGSTRLREIIEKITLGKGEPEDIDKLLELSKSMQDSALCGLGKTAPNPVLSTLTHFRAEYDAHVIDKKCPAHVCTNLKTIEITEGCIGCTKCTRICPVQAISGELKKVHLIDQTKCIKCDACISACPVHAIHVI